MLSLTLGWSIAGCSEARRLSGTWLDGRLSFAPVDRCCAALAVCSGTEASLRPLPAVQCFDQLGSTRASSSVKRSPLCGRR